MDLPMIAFELEGENGSVSLEISEVFGFPDETAYGGGYGACGRLEIHAGNCTVSTTHYFTTGELNCFEKELEHCYAPLHGEATLYNNTEFQLELALTFDKLGHVVIVGRYSEQLSGTNTLDFEIATDQTYIPKALSQLRRVAAVFGDHSQDWHPPTPISPQALRAYSLKQRLRFMLLRFNRMMM